MLEDGGSGYGYALVRLSCPWPLRSPLLFGLTAASTRDQVSQANATLSVVYPTSKDNQGTVAPGKVEIWTYPGTPGESVSVSVFADLPARNPDGESYGSQGMDTVVTLYEPDLTAFVFNDDIQSGVNTDSQIERYTFTRAGDYLIVVGSYNGQAGGTYVLNIEPVPDAATDVPEALPSPTFTPMPTLTPTAVMIPGG